MINLVTKHIAIVALVFVLQCNLEATAQIDSSNLDNNLHPVPSPSPKRRGIKKFVRITEAPPETIYHKPGSKLVLECLVSGKPAPSVEWFKNGESLSMFNEDSNEIMVPHATSAAQLISKLVLDSVSDGDVFSCVATAGLNKETATTTVYTKSDEELLILQKLLFKPSKPIISTYYENIFQETDTEIILLCRVFSKTKSQIYWQDSDNNLVYGDSGRMRVLPSGDLLISELLWTDMGRFTCVAKNMYGKDSIDTFVYPLIK